MKSSTVVCVKRVKQEASDNWDESMPLPGDIIEGVSEVDSDELLVPPKSLSELSAQLGKINRQQVEAIWLKVRRGDSVLNLRAKIMPEKSSLLQKRFTIKAANDDRHVAVLGDLTLDQCSELQEMSRRMVNTDWRSFRQKGVNYDWKVKVGTYLPDQLCSVVSSILIMPLQGEYNIGATTARCMAWFSAAILSGVPLVFVNIQTEQTITSKSFSSLKEKSQYTGKDSIWGVQQCHSSAVQILQGIRLWYLPGVAEIQVRMKPEKGETRFGIDIKRTDEGFICVFSVRKDSAADRAGVADLYEQANKTGHLLVISRLEGRSLMPSNACYMGFIQCCDHNEIEDTLVSAINEMDSIHVHFMSWPGMGKLTA